MCQKQHSYTYKLIFFYFDCIHSIWYSIIYFITYDHNILTYPHKSSSAVSIAALVCVCGCQLDFWYVTGEQAGMKHGLGNRVWWCERKWRGRLFSGSCSYFQEKLKWKVRIAWKMVFRLLTSFYYRFWGNSRRDMHIFHHRENTIDLARSTMQCNFNHLWVAFISGV